MTPYEALYGRPCRLPLCWTEVGENSITGLDMIRDISEKVSLEVAIGRAGLGWAELTLGRAKTGSGQNFNSPARPKNRAGRAK